MFHKIRYRLFLSNLLVLTVILLGSALAVRLVFIRNLKQQMDERLMATAQGTAASAEIEQGAFAWELEFPPQLLEDSQQAFQWFDTQGKLLEQQGNTRYVSALPFQAVASVKSEIDDMGLKVLTLPIFDKYTGDLIGYLRASQSPDPIEETIARLDIGLVVGAIVAVALSSLGSLWLNIQAMQPIEESFERLRQFTADASHELRSPLMAISTNAEVALTYSQGMRTSDGEKFKAIAMATEQMSQLTEDLLLLARFDQVSDLESTKVDLTNLLMNLVRLYKPQAQTKKIQLVAKIDQELWTEGDEVKLTRAFTNLIQNAIQYTPVGGKVKVQGERIDRELKIKVIDTGIGIAPEHLPFVFDRLWRANRSRSYYAGGSGLGLAITEAIVRHHKGTISVASKLKMGSIFVVYLPIVSN